MDRFFLLAMAAIPIALGVLLGIPLRTAWLRSTADSALASAAKKVVALGVSINLAVALAPLPELLSYPVYPGRVMHFPALARFFAVFAALASLGCVLPLAITAVRRGGPGRSRRLAAGALALALTPLPVHIVELWLVGRILGLHFFWR